MSRHIRDVVLINSFNPSATGVNRATTEPPLGLGYLAAVLRESGCRCQIIDADILQMGVAQVLEHVQLQEPSLFGISCTIVSYAGCTPLLRALRGRFPDSLLVVGGPFISSQAELCLSELAADLAVIGEGEETVRGIASAFNGELDSLSHVKGLLIVRRNGSMVRTQPRPLIENLDELPYPARDLFPEGHPYGSRRRGFPADAILTSRGCPYSCTYCNNEISLRRVRYRSIGNVLEELELLAQDGVRQLDILDENFTLDMQRAEEILDQIIARRYAFWINMMNGIRADRLTPRLVGKMKQAGVFCVSLGVESGDQGILNRCRKNLDLSQVLESTRWLRDAGIIVYGNFILGLPGDTPETMQRTIDFAITMDPHIANFQIAIPFPGTDLYREIERDGEFIMPTEKGVDFGFYAGKPFFEIGETRGRDVEAYFKKAYRRFYFRVSKIGDVLCSVRSASELKWLFKAASDKLLNLFR